MSKKVVLSIFYKRYTGFDAFVNNGNELLRNTFEIHFVSQHNQSNLERVKEDNSSLLELVIKMPKEDILAILIKKTYNNKVKDNKNMSFLDIIAKSYTFLINHFEMN